MAKADEQFSVTIEDVAKRAKVAPITVSRVINNSGYVSDRTRARVEAAIRELGYVPNMVARSLRSSRTNTLALVLSDISNPFWTTVARGVEDAARQESFNVILCNTDENEIKQNEYLSVLLRKRVDGFLLVPARNQGNSIRAIQQQRVPLVVLDRRVSNVDVDTVRSDSEGGAYQLTQYLLSLGHERIAMLSGPKDLSVSTDRVAGYRRALNEAGVDADPALTFYGAFTVESGKEMAQQAMSLSPRPTAFFGGNNFIGVGALHFLRTQNLRVPDDISLVNFDDLPPPLTIDPFFTVAVQSAYELGQQATELLLKRIGKSAASQPETPQEIVLPTRLIVRNSCRAIGAASNSHTPSAKIVKS